VVTYLTYHCMWCRPKYFKKVRKKLGKQDMTCFPN